MRINKQGAVVGGSVLGVLALAGGVSAYALTGNDSPAPRPSVTAVQHVVHPAADPVGSPAVSTAPVDPPVSSTPAPSPTDTTPAVGQSSVSVHSAPETTEATTVADKPKTEQQTSSTPTSTAPAASPTHRSPHQPGGINQGTRIPDASAVEGGK